jgi:unsaturated rhamnogalacturonyl hydrolase
LHRFIVMMLARFLLPLAGLVALSVAPVAAKPTANEVRSLIRLAARDHLAHPSGVDINHWVIAPFYDGLLRAGFATDDPSLIAAVVDFGQQGGWMPGYRFYHADDVAVGHAWLDLYRLDPASKERLGPIQGRLDHIIAHPITEELNDFTAKPKTPGVEVTDRWTWCDALYMAPPTLARLFALTGDAKYLTFLDQEYRFCYDRLYDKDARLFYRDSRFAGPKGKKSPEREKGVLEPRQWLGLRWSGSAARAPAVRPSEPPLLRNALPGDDHRRARHAAGRRFLVSESR